MISLDSLRPEFIDKTAERLKIVDKAVLERAIHAFVLLDRLAGTKAEFTFKGGTSLLLHLKEPRRLSVDIDTFCVMPADEFRSILEKDVCRNPPFFKMEEDLRGAYDQPQRRHYKLYYKTAYNKMRPDAYILLDVVEEDAKIDKITRPIKPFFTLDDGGIPSHVTMPSKSALLADKLTAFAPHTIGVSFDRGPDKDTAEHQVFKQLFDVVQLYDSGVDIEEVRRAYDILARSESSYRGGVYRPEDCLRDTLRTSYDITCIDLGRKKFADERFIRSGIDKMRNDVINGFDFTFPVARLYAAKAAFVAAQILAGRSVQVPDGVSPVSFAGNLKILTRTKTLNPDVYRHWAAVARLLPDWQPAVL